MPDALRFEPFELAVADGHVVRGDLLRGRGPSYVYLHGMGSVRTGEKSASLAEFAAAAGRPFLRVDLRGHGESSGRIGTISVSELIDDAEQVLAKVGPAILVGSSLGGMLAAFAAGNRPELVIGLALLAPALGLIPNLGRRLDADGRLWTSDGRGFVVDQRVLDDAHALDESQLPPRLTMPTLIVHGTADDVIPAASSERFYAALPSRRKDLWLVPDADHRLNTVAAAIWPRLDALLGL